MIIQKNVHNKSELTEKLDTGCLEQLLPGCKKGVEAKETKSMRFSHPGENQSQHKGKAPCRKQSAVH